MPKTGRSQYRFPALLLSLLILGGGIFLWYWQTIPGRLLQDAREKFSENPREARLLVEEAISLSQGNYPEAEMLRCQLLLQDEKPVEAMGSFSLIQSFESIPDQQLWDAVESSRQLHFDAFTERLLDITVQRKSLRTQSLETLIRLGLERQQWGNLGRFSRELFKEDEKSSLALFALGSVHYRSKQFKESEKCFRKVLEIDDDRELSQQAHYSLIVLLLDEARIYELENLIQEYRNTYGTSARLSLYESKLLKLMGKYQAGLELLETTTFSVEQMALEKSVLRGELLLHLNKLNEALADLDFVLQRQPWNHQAHYLLSMVYQRLNEPGKSKKHLSLSRTYTEARQELLRLEGMTAEEFNSDPDSQNRLSELYKMFGQVQSRDLRTTR